MKKIALAMALLLTMLTFISCLDDDKKSTVIAKKEIRIEEDQVVVVYEDGYEMPYSLTAPFFAEELITSGESNGHFIVRAWGTPGILSSKFPTASLRPYDPNQQDDKDRLDQEKGEQADADKAEPSQNEDAAAEKTEESRVIVDGNKVVYEYNGMMKDGSLGDSYVAIGNEDSFTFVTGDANGVYDYILGTTDGDYKVSYIQTANSFIEVDGKKYANCEAELYSIMQEKVVQINLSFAEELSVTTFSIAANGFFGYKNLQRIVISSALTAIDGSAFSGCEALTEVFYCGTAQEWEQVKITETGNDTLLNSTVYFYSETAPAEQGNYWRYVDGVATAWESAPEA